MDAAEAMMLALNVTLGISCGIPVARMLTRSGSVPYGTLKSLALLLLVYSIESIAFMASMGTSVLSMGLAVLWGILLGKKLRGSRIDKRQVSKMAAVFALYTSLPAASFLSVPVVAAVSGWSITSAEWGLRFGIPGFLPWPLNTILGFGVALSVVTVAFKVGATTALVKRSIAGGVRRSAEHA
jgi:hypothetical protein